MSHSSHRRKHAVSSAVDNRDEIITKSLTVAETVGTGNTPHAYQALESVSLHFRTAWTANCCTVINLRVIVDLSESKWPSRKMCSLYNAEDER